MIKYLDVYTYLIIGFFLNIGSLFCYNNGLLFSSLWCLTVNLTCTLENRAASGHEAPKVLQKFSWVTGFQVSGEILLLPFLAVYIPHLIYILLLPFQNKCCFRKFETHYSSKEMTMLPPNYF